MTAARDRAELSPGPAASQTPSALFYRGLRYGIGFSLLLWLAIGLLVLVLTVWFRGAR